LWSKYTTKKTRAKKIVVQFSSVQNRARGREGKEREGERECVEI
jgi:hypothetical protein